MDPIVNTAVTLAGTQGISLLRHRAEAAERLAWRRRRKPDRPADAALAALAVAPHAASVLGPALASYGGASLETLRALHKARPWLDAVGTGALAALAYRQGRLGQEGRWLSAGMQAIAGLRVAGSFVTPSIAFDPHADGRIVVTARELDRLLAPDAPVVGLVVEGEARCWPLALLRRPHVLHDAVGGHPVAITWCPFAHAAVAFRDVWRGHRLDLVPVGMPAGNMAFYEGRSDGMIHQLAAAIGAGPQAGARLQTFPAVTTTWKAWRSLHPATGGLWFETLPPTTPLTRFLAWLDGVDARRPEPPMPIPGGIDPRLPAKAEVLGAWLGDEALAVPREVMRARPVLELSLGGEPIVVLYDARRDMAMAFLRRHEGKVLSFEHAEHGDAVAADRETGRMWDVTGQARDEGQPSWLRPVSHAVDRVRWYAWAHVHPRTTLAGEARGAARARPSA